MRKGAAVALPLDDLLRDHRSIAGCKRGGLPAAQNGENVVEQA
jgi:hypothetical protein